MIKVFFVNFKEENVHKDLKFKVGDFTNTVMWIYLICDLNGEEIIGTFCEKESQKTNQKEFG